MDHVGDLASDVADKLAREAVEEAMREPEAEVDQQQVMVRQGRRTIFEKIEFRWRDSDSSILDKIRAACDEAFWHLFEDAIAALDQFYASVRVPVVQTVGEHDVVKLDSAGRVIWQTDSTGQMTEDWSRLTGDDLEKCLLDLARLRMTISPQVNELLNEAVFAKHIAEEMHWEGYSSLVEGTQGDRNAYASRHSRVDKYHAFFRYYLWSSANTFVTELDRTTRLLERIRDWRIRSQRG